MDRTRPYLLIGQTKTISGWVRPMTKLGPIFTKTCSTKSPSKGDETVSGVSICTNNYRAKAPSQVSPSKPPPGWPKGIRTNPTAQVACPPTNPNDSNNIGLHITKIATISKEAFAALD